jgi:hypothetical protein
MAICFINPDKRMEFGLALQRTDTPFVALYPQFKEKWCD